MQTIYDWVTVAFFAGLVVLLLQRSIGPEESQDSMYHYIAPALGCAVTNWLGNNGTTSSPFSSSSPPSPIPGIS